MSTDTFDPAAALDAYYPNRTSTSNRTARLWSVEKQSRRKPAPPRKATGPVKD